MFTDQEQSVAPPDSSSSVFDRMILVLVVTTSLLAVAVLISVLRAPAGAAATEEPESAVVDATLSEFAIGGTLTADPGPVQIEVTNDGTQIHNLVLVGGESTPDLDPGESATLDLGELEAGTYTVFCAIAGHREAGMEADLVVGGDAATHEEHETGTETAGEEVDYSALDMAMTESIMAFPAETEGRGNQPLEPEVLDDGTKRFELTAAVTPWEVEPGVMVDAWSYNGMVPGPQIRVDVGDRIQVVVHNELPMGTDVHWHGVRVPNSMDGVAPITQPLIESGDTFTYEFVVEHPAIAMYHAHHHGQMQVPNGLFGTFIAGDIPIPYGQTVSGVTIPENLDIALEIPMVLNDAGVIGLSLNGKSFPATEPYVIEDGDWVVVHYYNEGLQSHPMHPHQFPMLVFARDGIPLDHPYFADTLSVAPGERFSVLMHMDDPGTWVFHCHILNHVERDTGMFGMVTAFVVEEAEQ
ncbi:MAG TPA: multicopper oxidase domain-containing protein [Acidimicrobiia bacterium]|nr:multicopper oxidase domain-containing protein [Acidimicrobiia bacterium]